MMKLRTATLLIVIATAFLLIFSILHVAIAMSLTAFDLQYDMLRTCLKVLSFINSLVYWAFLCFLCIFFVVLYRKQRSGGRCIDEVLEPELQENPDAAANFGEGKRERIGGWLCLPAIGLVLSVLFMFITLGIHVTQFFLHGDIHLLLFFFLFDFGMLSLTLYASYLFFRKRRNAPGVMIVLYALAPIVAVFLFLVSQNPQLLLNGLCSLVGAAIWIPYFLVSKRVKRTFIFPLTSSLDQKERQDEELKE